MSSRTQVEARAHESEDTRDKILAAAQKLFAEKGFESTSVRDITTEAGCNVAAVNYHFGGKEKLYLESFRGLLRVLRDQRIRVITEFMDRDPAPTLEEWVDSFAVGFLDPLVGESWGRFFLGFVSREMINPRLPSGVFVEEFIDPLMERSIAALAAVGPPMEESAARLCLMSMVGQLLHALKSHRLFGRNGRHDLMPEILSDYIDHFVRFSVGGIRACALHEVESPEVTA